MAFSAGTRQIDLKRMLQQRREAILSDLRHEMRTAAGNAVPRAGDAVDESEAMLQDTVRFALITMKTERAVRIDRALLRLADGGYGICDECGGEIAESRLRALPFAERCRPCEEQHEELARLRPLRTWQIGAAVNNARLRS